MQGAIDTELTWEQLSLISFFLTCLIISNITAAKIVAFDFSPQSSYK